MSRENLELVQRHVDAFNRRDLGTWLAMFRSDAEIDWSRARGPFKGVYRGHDRHEAWWEVFLTFDWSQVETYDVTDAGSDVVVPNSTTFRGRQGIEVVARSTLVYTV